jgi:hypothetical protein
MVTVRVAVGVQAIWLTIAERRRTIRALIPREALETCCDVGPEQDDLLHAFSAHRQAIETEVRQQTQAARGEVFLIKDLTRAAAVRLPRGGRNHHNIMSRQTPTPRVSMNCPSGGG